MSKKLLLELNGRNDGAFRKWLSSFTGEPRIAWYPSAGEDFRDLLYLHPKFAELRPASKPEPRSPDIFLHTDYFPWSTSTFLDTPVIHSDDRTSIFIKSMEELPCRDLPLDEQIVAFPNGSHATGRVLFLELNVGSHLLGDFSVPVIYGFVENAAFCARVALPQEARFSHIIHVRFGGGCGGGGLSSGTWLLNVLPQLHCEVFITDGHYAKGQGRQSGDERTYARYPSLAGSEDDSQFESIRVVHSEGWSGHGDVSWNLVRTNV